jgi:hypothetical protein
MLLICTMPGWRDAVVGTLPWGLSLHGSMADWGIMTPVTGGGYPSDIQMAPGADVGRQGRQEEELRTENKFTHPALQHILIALSSKSINVLRSLTETKGSVAVAPALVAKEATLTFLHCQVC